MGAIVQRQTESGLSQVAFCTAEGLSVSSLQNRKPKFVREGRFSEAPPTPAAPWFAELAVSEAGVEPEPAGEPAPSAWQIGLIGPYRAFSGLFGALFRPFNRLLKNPAVEDLSLASSVSQVHACGKLHGELPLDPVYGGIRWEHLAQ